MKYSKIIGRVMVVILTFLLVGCGGGGGSADGDGKPALHHITVSASNFKSNDKEGTVTLRFRADQLSPDMQLKLSHFLLVGDNGYTISSYHVDPETVQLFRQGDQAGVTFGFAYRSARSDRTAIKLSDLRLGYTKEIVSKLSGDSITEKIEPTNILDNYSVGTHLLSDTGINVTSKDSDVPVHLYLFRINGDGTRVPLSEETIVANYVLPDEGKLSTYEEKTDATGTATFIYNPPEKFTERDVTLSFYLKNDRVIKTDAVIHLRADIVNSGEVYSISLVYKGTDYDEGMGLFKDRYAIHAVDEYSNPVEGAEVSMTIVNGWKVVRNSGGMIYSNDGISYFKDNGDLFVGIDPTLDRVVIRPTDVRNGRAYLGPWGIASIPDKRTLILDDVYKGSPVDNLSYIIGGDQRVLGGAIANANVQRDNYITDENGVAEVTVVYDPLLVGHTYTVAGRWSSEEGRRVGLAQRESFRGNGYESTTDEVKEDGKTHQAHIYIAIKPNHEKLIGVEITPDSIQISDKDNCFLKTSESDLRTDDNGMITVAIATNDTNGTCSVSWSNQNSGIYYEY